MPKQELIVPTARSHLLASTVNKFWVCIGEYLPAVNISKDFGLIDFGIKFYYWVALAVATNRTLGPLHM